MTNQWPLQSQCDAFYGNPRLNLKLWESKNLTRIEPPFMMAYDGRAIKHIVVHKKCAESLLKVLGKIWDAAEKDQKKINEAGVSIYDGCYNFRNMRGSNRLSMHAYACAIDLDAGRNGLGNPSPRFNRYPWVVDAFEQEGWVWGGRWSAKRRDGMHFQAARIG